jgi:hypothetical protein
VHSHAQNRSHRGSRLVRFLTLTSGLALAAAAAAVPGAAAASAQAPLLLGVPIARATLAEAPAAPTPPANDEVANAQAIPSLPTTLNGTTVAATTVPGEASSACGGQTVNSVWYVLHASSTSAQRIGIELAAAGKLDAAVDVYHAVRSALTPVACEQTEEEGKASLTFNAVKNGVYDIRVAALQGSQLAGFTISAFLPTPAATPPGQRLPASGASGQVDRIQDVNAAYAVTLHAGVSYLFNLTNRTRHGACVSGALFPPGTRSFEGAGSLLQIECGGYKLFTPGPGMGGLYTFEITPREQYTGVQRFHLQVAPAGSDETAPGQALGNYGVASARLNGGGVQILRLYRIDVTSHSNLTLRLRAPQSAEFNLRLLDQNGDQLACQCGSSGSQTLQQKLRAGRYYAAVSVRNASVGNFTLERESRTITRTAVYFAGASAHDGRASAPAGRETPIHLHVSPAASGPVTVEIERFDPVFGWQFYRQLRAQVSAGTASLPFTAPAVGQFRVDAVYAGSRVSSPSRVGFSYLLVH